MSNYFTIYKIVAVLAFAAVTATILCTIIIVYTISVCKPSLTALAITATILWTIIIVDTISVCYFSIMVTEKGWVVEKGCIQTNKFF